MPSSDVDICCLGSCVDIDPCADITCSDSYYCVDGSCQKKTCDQMQGIICSGDTVCSEDTKSSSDTSNCCLAECITEEETCQTDSDCDDGDSSTIDVCYDEFSGDDLCVSVDQSVPFDESLAFQNLKELSNLADICPIEEITEASPFVYMEITYDQAKIDSFNEDNPYVTEIPHGYAMAKAWIIECTVGSDRKAEQTRIYQTPGTNSYRISYSGTVWDVT